VIISNKQTVFPNAVVASIGRCVDEVACPLVTLAVASCHRAVENKRKHLNQKTDSGVPFPFATHTRVTLLTQKQ